MILTTPLTGGGGLGRWETRGGAEEAAELCGTMVGKVSVGFFWGEG